ncbi:hypothetical protein [Streptomyces sp. NPDC002133]|uniref:hypothetical protein n=1 Tax=Streptomyces sp. NPDC002133 TaxID=3154409 RepID=UPI00331F4BBE
MRFKRFTVAAAVMASALAFTASPASADEQKWQTVSTNEWWSCGPGYKHHKVSYNVNYKWCHVRNAGGYAQAVLVVQNKSSAKVNIEGAISTNIPGGDEDCAPSTLGPGATRGCFGPTKWVGTGVVFMTDVRLKLNNVDEWYSDAEF